MHKYKVGDKIGDLELISFSGIKWNMKCICGNIWAERTSRLGERIRCPKCSPISRKGNKHHKAGDRIGNGIILEKTEAGWKVQCGCGAISMRAPYQLEKYSTCQVCSSSEEIGKRKRIPGNMSLYYERLRYYLRGAEERELCFEFTRDEFYSLLKSPCHYCGEIGSMEAKRKDRSIRVNGIDRVDNTRGYTPSNCVPCCSFCNHAKKDHSYKYFIDKIKQIAEYISSETIPEGSTDKCLET